MSALAYDDGRICLVHGSHHDLDAAGAPLAIVDPPYGDTSLPWDRLATDWLDTVNRTLAPTASVWLWGSLRSLVAMIPAAEARGWKQSQDVIHEDDDTVMGEVVWEKHNGSGSSADRFRRVHEQAVLLYRGRWSEVHHQAQHSLDATPRRVHRKQRPTHWGVIGEAAYETQDGGQRLLRSVMYERSAHGSALHPTQKPLGVTMSLIRYSCPPDGLVVVPYAGSGTDLLAARHTGRRALGAEIGKSYATAAADRLDIAGGAA